MRILFLANSNELVPNPDGSPMRAELVQDEPASEFQDVDGELTKGKANFGAHRIKLPNVPKKSESSYHSTTPQSRFLGSMLPPVQRLPTASA